VGIIDIVAVTAFPDTKGDYIAPHE